MVDENLTDQQQAELIRKWLRENGLFILGGLVLGFASLFGWEQWQGNQLRDAEEASALYEDLVGKIQASKQEEAESLLAELQAGYAGSPYIDHARLRLARLSMDRNDFGAAAGYLEAIVRQSDHDEVVQIARVRLARVLMQQGQYDEALAALEQADSGSAFYAQVNDVRGDILFVLNRNSEALAAYDAALTDNRQPPSIDRAYVQAKRDSLAVGEELPGGMTVIDTAADGEAPAAAD